MHADRGKRTLLVRTNYCVRTSAFAYCFATIGLLLWERAAGPGVWALFALQFLVYPHLAYWRALRSANPNRAERDNLYLDAALLGAWAAFLGFPTWITLAILGSTLLNAAVNRGALGVAVSFACTAVGALSWIVTGGLRHMPETSFWVTVLTFCGVLIYTTLVGYVLYWQNRYIKKTREALRASEESYRLIAENAADLIAMVDHEARWIYSSPSYGRILDAASLAPGADAFAKAHPDDAEAARAAVGRAAATGKAREIALRVVDREGRIRQHRTRLQAIGDEAPRRVLLVSQDVTDLKESEERLLLAAHALEGMTEAIMITAADGTVVTVNRAFTEVTGLTKDHVLGRPEKEIRNALQPPEFWDEVYATVQREGYWSGTTWCKRANGSVYREWRSIRAVRDGGGAVTHYVCVFYEVGSPKASAGATGTP